MNKRIEELLTQSSKEVWSNNPFNGSPEFEGYEVDQEKFTNLIVQECIKVINDGVLNSDGSGDWYAGYVAGATECLRKLNQHFGVKE